MLRDWTSHGNYQKKLIADLTLLSITDRARVFRYEPSILKLFMLNLDKAYPIINKLYPENKGIPAKNQVEILRSFVLMMDLKHSSITLWSKEVACDKLLCAMCGFDFDDVPSVASYYDLPKHKGAVKKFADLAMEDKLREYRYELIFQEILSKVVVETSADMGLLGDINKLSLAGDGTPFYSGVSHYGTKVCDCKKKGVFKCKCPRKYSDPDATWGWDSYREQYFFGSTLFTLTASDSPNDLPVYLRNAQAQRHDSIITIFALNEVRKMYRDFTITDFIADGAMDNYPTYDLCNRWGIRPFIPLDSRTKFNLKNMPPGVIAFDDKGRPICEGGIPYVNWGWCPKKQSVKYRCYFDAMGLDKPCSCTDSDYGRTVYIKTDNDPRLFPPVLRSSQTFKNKLRDRTSVERTHKRKFEDYIIESGNMRSNKHRFARATFAAINVHLDAWLKHTNLTLDKLLAA